MDIMLHSNFEIGDTIYAPTFYYEKMFPERCVILEVIYRITDNQSGLWYKVDDCNQGIGTMINAKHCFRTKEECEAWCNENQ